MSAIAAGLIPVIQDYKTHRGILLPYVTAYLFLVLGATASVLEGFLLPDLLNFVEHFFGVTTAAFAFLLTTYLSHRHIKNTKEKGRRLGRIIR